MAAVLDLRREPGDTEDLAAAPGGRPGPKALALGAPDPRTGLVASLSVPAAAQAGEVLHYRVTLSNPTASDVPLEPCPDFLQTFGVHVKEPHALNCAAARPVPAGGSETFAMELVVPTAPSSRKTVLTWILQLGQDLPVPAFAEVLVTDGPVLGDDRATCTPATREVPCSSMAPGVDYPFTLETHCGIHQLYADDRLWVSDAGQVLDDGSDNPPPGIDSPFDAGSVTLLKPTVELRWVSRRGNVFTFHPLTTADPVLQPCD